MSGKALPSALRAMRRAWREATDERLRDRYSDAIRHLERLYGFRTSLPEETGDMRRREIFTKSPHRIEARAIRPINTPDRGIEAADSFK
jgi:hypothetical protein